MGGLSASACSMLGTLCWRCRLTDWGVLKDGSQTKPASQESMRVHVLVFQAQCLGMLLEQRPSTALVGQPAETPEDASELMVNSLETAVEVLTLLVTMGVAVGVWGRIWRTTIGLR